MQKPLKLPEDAAKWLLRVLVSAFIIIDAGMTTFIIVVWRKGFHAKVANLELHGAVTRIYQPERRDTKWYVAKLSDGKSIVLEDAMLGVLKAGDSLFKKRGEDYYIL